MLKIKEILLYIIIFVFSLLFSFLLVFSLINNLYKFNLINVIALFVASISISVFISIALVVLTILYIHTKKPRKIFYWLNESYPKLVLGCILLILFSFSIQTEVLWSATEISEVLSIMWTIFGLSITIFLVWNVVIVNYLKGKQPWEKEEKDLGELYKYLTEKQLLAQDTKLIFNTVTLLVINLFVLIFATVSIYIIKQPESLFTQNITICAFYFCTNTLVSLFLDILRPLQKDKKELLDKNKVGQKELVAAEAGAEIQMIIEVFNKTVNENNELTKEEKKELNIAFCDLLSEKLQNKEEKSVNEIKDKTENNI